MRIEDKLGCMAFAGFIRGLDMLIKLLETNDKLKMKWFIWIGI